MENAEGLRPELVEEIDFAVVRRGYEPERVRRRLQEAAAEIRRLNTEMSELSERFAQFEASPPDDLEARVAEALGDETVKVLQAARRAAQERIARAEAESAELVERAHSAAVAIVDESRDRGAEMVQEARDVRERILTDLARKRRTHRMEVEQLRTVRDHLLESLSICQQGLASWVEELVQVVPRARAAAERAGLLVAAEPEDTVSEFEAEIETGRLMGLPLDEMPAGDEAAAEPGEPLVAESGRDDGPSDSASIRDEDEPVDGDAESDAHDPQAEPEELSEPPLEPVAGSQRIAPYDIEAEPEGGSDESALAGFNDEFGLGSVGDAAESVVLVVEDAAESVVLVVEDAAESADESVEEMEDGEAVILAAEEVDEPAAGASPPSDAGAIFARLRAVGQRFSGEAAEPAEPEPPAEADPPVADPPESKSESGEPPEAAADDGAAAPVVAAEHVEEGSEEDDLISAARAVAVGEIARRLKRIVVDEQGELLDALRRMGPRALEARVGLETTRYARAVRGPMEDFASDIDVSIDDINLEAASGAVVSVLVDPVRSRLRDLAAETDDLEAVSAVVRAVYRESRSRRADAAAAEAFAKGWHGPVA